MPKKNRAGKIIDSQTLADLLLVVPFFVGALIVHGFVLKSLTLFSIVFISILVGRFAWLQESSKRWRLTYCGLNLLLVPIFWEFSSDLRAVLMFIAAAILLPAASSRLVSDPETPRGVIGKSIAALLLPALLASIGTYSQVGHLIISTSVLGLIPGSILAARILVVSSHVFERAGWQRLVKRTGYWEKFGSAEKPGGISILLSSYIVVVPGVVLMSATVGWLPMPFVLAFVLVIFGAQIATQFLQGRDASIPEQLLSAAALSELAMVILGLLSRAG